VKKRSPLVGFDFFQDVKTHKADRSPIHRTILNAGMCQIEALHNLNQLKRHEFLLSAFPVLFEGAEGSLARVVAIEDY